MFLTVGFFPLLQVLTSSLASARAEQAAIEHQLEEEYNRKATQQSALKSWADVERVQKERQVGRGLFFILNWSVCSCSSDEWKVCSGLGCQISLKENEDCRNSHPKALHKKG
jgi:hypothetical protein